jgi:large subunit ribosomal protein L35
MKLKLKTSKSAFKRFRFSSKDKIQRRRAHMNHYNAKESGSERRDKRSQRPLAKSNEKDVKNLMPYNKIQNANIKM